MISYEVYKVLHLTSLVLLFSGFAVQLFGVRDRKALKIATGAATLLVLVSGMGLMARLGIGHGEAWPHWIFVKFAIWLVVGVGAAVVVKRFPALGPKVYVILLALFALAATTANLKF